MFILGRIPLSSVNGPGRRAVIHVQGCTLSCRGCWNPETHKHGLGRQFEPIQLAQWISSQGSNIEGVTFSGGEPLQQADELYVLLRLIRVNMPKLSIGMFTGYTLKELEAGDFHWFNGYRMMLGFDLMWEHVLSNLDFAVMGRYNEQKHTNDAAMRGSTNQTVELFSDRYKESDFLPQAVEIIISPDGQLVNITGFPASHQKLKDGL